MFNSTQKEEALQKLEEAKRKYELAGTLTNAAVQSLYDTKKEAVEAIEAAEKILIKQPDFGTNNIRKIADAKKSIRLFQEAVQNELESIEKTSKSIQDSTGKYTGTAVAGAAAGAAVATFGPTAAMAFSTTFGTEATGTAISALSGAAATNAALAWLGGGALAVGGGGMAAGSTILAMAGPIGWAIGGITVGAVGFFKANKNKKIAEQANEATDKIDKILKELCDLRSEIHDSRAKILDDTAALNSLMNDGHIKDNYPEIVEIIRSLCFNISKKFSI